MREYRSNGDYVIGTRNYEEKQSTQDMGNRKSL